MTTPNDDGLATTSFDPKLMTAITAVVLALLPTGYSAWRALGRSSPTLVAQEVKKEQERPEQDAVKQKRSKERRKRAPAPKLGKGPASEKKAVVRQPSALPQKRKQGRAPSVAASEPSVSNAEHYSDETPRQPSVLRFEDPSTSIASTYTAAASPNLSLHPDAMHDARNAGPANVPLPPSPLLEPLDTTFSRSHPHSPSRPHSPSPNPRRDPSPSLASPTGSTSASTSGTPLTPASLATSQVLPLPSLHLYNPDRAWEWSEQTPIPQPALPSGTKDIRGRSLKASKALAMSSPTSTRSQELTFPTLNTMPPPSTPLEDQVQILRESVEASRVREQAARSREEALSSELDRLRTEAEEARQEVARMQWHLYHLAQRDEQWQNQLHAMHLQLQAYHHSHHSSQTTQLNMPVPVYPNSPLAYPPPPFYAHSHPYPPPSPLTGSQQSQSSTPNSLLSPPTHINSLPPLQFGGRQNMTSTPLDTMQPPPVSVYHPHIPAGIPPFSHPPHSSQHPEESDTIDLDEGLIEAIMKRPESLRSASGSFSRSGSEAGTRSTGTGSRSASVNGMRDRKYDECGELTGTSISISSVAAATKEFPINTEILNREEEEDDQESTPDGNKLTTTTGLGSESQDTISIYY